MNDVVDELLSEAQREVAALFLPLSCDTLLVPMAAVAEVTNEQMPISPLGHPDKRFYGWISWRGQQLALLSFEALSGDEPVPYSTGSHVVILNAAGAARNHGFYGLLIQGYPQRIDIADSEDVRPEVRPTNRQGVLYELVINGEFAYIPDFELMESAVAQVPVSTLGTRNHG